MGHIWLIGMMGSGKSTVGRLLAERLGRPFYDTDAMIEGASGSSIAEIFEHTGETGFREQERAAIAEVAGSRSGVVAAGGGVVLDVLNVDAMKSSGLVVLLSADVGVLAARVEGASDRPLLSESGDRGLHAIAEARDGFYRAAADVVVDGNGSIEIVTDRVEAACNAS
jgi:shikimate kinase